jgi:hypothetical protein
LFVLRLLAFHILLALLQFLDGIVKGLRQLCKSLLGLLVFSLQGKSFHAGGSALHPGNGLLQLCAHSQTITPFLAFRFEKQGSNKAKNYGGGNTGARYLEDACEHTHNPVAVRFGESPSD